MRPKYERDNRTRKKKIGRPRIVTDRDERKLVLVLMKLRKTDGFLNSKKLQLQAGLTHLSNRTVRTSYSKQTWLQVFTEPTQGIALRQ